MAQSSGYVTIGEVPKVAGPRNANLQAKITLKVKDGYHVNSNTPSEEYLIPLKLTWKSTGALEGGQVTYPKPAVQRFDFQTPAEKPLSIYTGSVDLVVNFKVAGNAQAGPGVAVGQLRYQACSDKACYPPKNIEVSVPYTVQPGS
ncbi:MAG TPA: protein-disulfide reductase DsbD domain-containing protein [Bryobacteraceae bacterium]|nr:protein-disulfide reductase DsbD domain-containing protein [Bryobacteraceae bacterium]